MPDSRKARRIADPGLQPERTSLAWFRTLLGYGALMALVLKHNWHQAGALLWVPVATLAAVATILWHYARIRNLLDVLQCDFPHFRGIRAKFMISFAGGFLAILLAAIHISQLIVLLGSMA